MRMPAAGELRQRVKLLKPFENQDALGAAASDYEQVGETWAKIEPLTGSEKLRAQMVQAEMTHRVTIRYRTDLSEDMIFEHEGRKLRILSIADFEMRHRWQECMCKEIVGS